MAETEWTVEVEFYVPRVNVRVKGADYSEATSAAYDQAQELAKKLGPEVTAHVRVLEQHGEPWVRFFRSGGWYDLHGPGDVIVFERSKGHAFTVEDVALLKGRIRRVLGIKVVEHWNGEGCSSLSVRAAGRDGTGPMTEEQSVKILAPRRGKTDA